MRRISDNRDTVTGDLDPCWKSSMDSNSGSFFETTAAQIKEEPLKYLVEILQPEPESIYKRVNPFLRFRTALKL